jgi:hypothetical protein
VSALGRERAVGERQLPAGPTRSLDIHTNVMDIPIRTVGMY